MPLERLFNIADRFEVSIATALREAFAEIQSQITLSQIENALRTQGIPGAIAILNELEVEGIIQSSLVNNLEDAVRDSGRILIPLVPAAAVTGVPFVFRTTHQRIANFLENYSLALVQQVSDQTRMGIRQALVNDFIAGRNPRDTARVFRNSVGLTTRMEAAVRNYERALRELDPIALQRELRDRRFDRGVARAIQERSTLPEERIQRFVQRYRERAVRQRAETIARTESLRAISIGQHFSMLQAVDDGAIEGELLRRFWVYTRDSRTRIAHRQIPGLNPEGVGINQPFTTPLGPLLFPRDPNGIGANTINCRCSVVLRLIDPETGTVPGRTPMTHNVQRRT